MQSTLSYLIFIQPQQRFIIIPSGHYIKILSCQQIVREAQLSLNKVQKFQHSLMFSVVREAPRPRKIKEMVEDSWPVRLGLSDDTRTG